MIELLHINEYVYLKNVDIYFSDGLNVITGETGTGKSLLLDIIGAFLDYGSIRSDVFSADVVVYIPRNFEEGNISVGQHIFSVEKRGKRSFYKVDGRLIAKDIVQKVFSDIVTIHKQNSHIKLLEREFIINFLDDIANNEEFVKEYRKLYSQYQNVLKLIATVDETKLREKIEELKEKVTEIESAKLDLSEEEKLENDYKKALNVRTLIQNYTIAMQQLEEIEHSLRKLYALTEDKHHETIDKIIEYIAELENNVSKELIRFDEVNVENIENRLWVYRKLRRKYGPSTEDVLTNLKNWREELIENEKLLSMLKTVGEEKVLIENQLRQLAAKISERRRKAAEFIVESVIQHLRDLNMNTRIDFSFSTKEISLDGIDDVELVGNTLSSGPLYPLRKIASGGELSRIMLSIELSTASTPTLIYDEIDAGVGGITAVKLAEKLDKLSKNHQIIVVTHLPQIALRAHKHFALRREKDTGYVVELDEKGRAEEIKRMFGGKEIIEIVSEKNNQ